MLSQACWILLGWLIAGIPTGLLLGKWLANIDISQEGSLNIGATNAARVLGKGIALLTLTGDILKGFLPVLGALLLFEDDRIATICAVACFCGHCWSPYLKFQGGKGVATVTGVMLALSPFVLLSSLSTWLLVFGWKRISSLSALAAAVVLPIAAAVLHPSVLPVSAVLAVGIIVRHQDNIHRLRKGGEKPWRHTKPKAPTRR